MADVCQRGNCQLPAGHFPPCSDEPCGDFPGTQDEEVKQRVRTHWHEFFRGRLGPEPIVNDEGMVIGLIGKPRRCTIVLNWQGFEKRIANWIGAPPPTFETLVMKRPTARFMEKTDDRFWPVPPRWEWQLDRIEKDSETGELTGHYTTQQDPWDITEESRKRNI